MPAVNGGEGARVRGALVREKRAFLTYLRKGWGNIRVSSVQRIEENCIHPRDSQACKERHPDRVLDGDEKNVAHAGDQAGGKDQPEADVLPVAYRCTDEVDDCSPCIAVEQVEGRRSIF